MTIPKIIKNIALTICTLGVITGMTTTAVLMWGEVAAVAQIVHDDRCHNARVKLAEYEAVVLQSGKPATQIMSIAMALLQKIIDESC